MNSFYIKVNNKMERLAVLGWFNVLVGTKIDMSNNNKILGWSTRHDKSIRKEDNQLSISSFLECESIEEACEKAGGKSE